MNVSGTVTERTAMNDSDQLEQLLSGFHSCVSIITQEEAYARRLVTEAAINLQMDVFLWTIIDGVREAAVSNCVPIRDTEHPAAGLLYLSQLDGEFIVIALDLVEHLSDARTLRVMKDLLNRFEQTGSTLVLIDHSNKTHQLV